jgi:hypothetical protein
MYTQMLNYIGGTDLHFYGERKKLIVRELFPHSCLFQQQRKNAFLSRLDSSFREFLSTSSDFRSTGFINALINTMQIFSLSNKF